MNKKLLAAALAASMVVGICPVAGADEAVTLRFIDVSPSPERQAYFESTFAKFEEETGIAVAYESVPWDDAANKLTVLGTSGQLPDVMTLHSFWLGQFTEAEWVLPINEYVEEHASEFTEVVNKFHWKQEMEKYGNYYTIPDGYMTKGIYYRKDWVEEIGYEIPTGADWTWDAYFDLIKALYDEEQNRYGNAFRGGRGGFDVVLTYLQTTTGGLTYDEEGNFLLDTPECVEMLEKFCSIYTEGYVPTDSINWGFVEQVDNFTGGLVGTLYNDTEVLVTCEAKMDPEVWGILPAPASADGTILTTCGSSYSYGIAATSEHPEEALQLIDFLARGENNIEYCKIAGQIPIKNEVLDDPAYGEDTPYGMFIQQLNDPNLVVPTSYGQFNYTDLHQDMMHAELQKCLLGKQTAEDVLVNIGTELENRMKAYLEENPDAAVETPSALTAE